jgi:fluoride exporter
VELITDSTAPRPEPSEPTQSPGPSHAPIDRPELVAIAAGGAFGAVARVAVNEAIPQTVGQWPWATFAVNISGTFLLGCLLAYLKQRDPITIPLYRLLGTGFCSTFTTFATMQLELVRMIEAARYEVAVGYAAASVALGYLAILSATKLVARLRTLRS